MSLTPDEIAEEECRWPQDKAKQLLDRLVGTLHHANPAVEEAWKQETRWRIAGIENGAVCGISGEEVTTRIRERVGR